MLASLGALRRRKGAGQGVRDRVSGAMAERVKGLERKASKEGRDGMGEQRAHK